MRLRTILVIGAIFVALGSFVYFHEIRGGAQRREAAEKAKVLLGFAVDEARRLTIERRDTTIVLQRGETEWRLTAPVADVADQQAVERYLRNLTETERRRVVADSAATAENPELLNAYGLQPPRLVVHVETASGPLPDVAFGEDTPNQQNTYVQVRGAAPEILLVPAWRFDNLDKGAFDLRDRRVLPFERDEVREVRLTRAAAELVAVRQDEGKWRLVSPVDVDADADELMRVLDRVRNGRVEAFVSESPAESELVAYGLAPPTTLELSLIVGDDRAERRLRVGAADGASYYARDVSSPQVFLVDSSLVRELQVEASALRNRKPVVFDREQVTRLELSRAGLVFAASRDTSGTWSIVEPEARRAKQWQINRMLTDLADLEVEQFMAPQGDLAPYGLETPALGVRLFAGTERVVDASLGRGLDGGAFLSLGHGGEVFTIDAARIDDLDLGLDQVAEPATAPPPSEDSTDHGP